MRLGLDQAFRLGLCASVLGILGLWALAGTVTAAPTASLSGRVVDEQGGPLGGAHLVLTGPIAAGQLVIRADPAGRFEIPSLSHGLYQLEVLHDGFFPLRQELEIRHESIHLELALTRQRLKQTVDVVSSIFGVDPQQTSRTRTLTEEQITHVPFAPSHDFQKALTILPGVATDTHGRLHVNGGASDQILYLLDGFNLTSPVSGALENNFSVDAVRAADVRSSRYSAEYGKGSSGAVTVTTKTGDDRFRHGMTDFIPSFDTKKGGKGGLYLKDWAPRFTLSGPVVRHKVWFLNAFDAKYDQDVIPGLPDGADRSIFWRWNNLLRLQAQLGPSHVLGATYLHNSARFEHSGLDLFNPLEATRNIHGNNDFIGLKDQGYWHGVLAEVGFSVNRLDLRKDPLGEAPFVIEPDRRRGNFFLRTQREAERQQWMANFAPRPFYGLGRHEFKFGLDFDRILYRQVAHRRSFEVLRAPGVPWRKTTFVGSPEFTRNNLEWNGYVQDRWSPVDRFLVELGLRHDWNRVVGRQLLSPRLAVAAVPWAGKDIKLSAGIGVFHDATNLSAVSRSLDQRQFDTFFMPDGRLSWGPAETVFRTSWKALRAPRVLNWSAGWEQTLPYKLALRVNFLQKRGSQGFTFENLLPQPRLPYFAIYELQNTRRDRYSAVEFTLNQVFSERARWMASFVRSSARSNAVLDYTIENPFFAGQGAGPLDWDMPNRALFSGWVPFRKRYTFSYFLEWRDGTPFSVINDQQELVGAPNRLRLPRYVSLNTHVEREFEVAHYRWAVRVGFNNVTAHENFSFVNNNIASPKFLIFGGGERRSMTFRLRYLGRK